MEKTSKLRAPCLLLSILLLLNNIVAGFAAAAMPVAEFARLRTCNGTDEECAAAEAVTAMAEAVEDAVGVELPLDLEIHRRILADGKHITPQAQNANHQVCVGTCSKPGKGYTAPHCTYQNKCRH